LGGGAPQAAAKEVDDLKKKVADAEAARDAAVKNAEALKKQAEGLSTEYTRLQKEKESLQNKLDRFEIMIMDAIVGAGRRLRPTRNLTSAVYRTCGGCCDANGLGTGNGECHGITGCLAV